MKCINCGAEIKAEYNNCPYCGKIIQIVPDYNIYDEDDIDLILESTKDIPSKKEKEKEKTKPKAQETSPAKKKKNTQEKKIIFICILLCVILFSIGIAVKLIVDHNNHNSYEYQMKQGNEAMFREHYDTAEEYYMQALALSPNDSKVRLKLADIYIKQEDTEKAIELLKEAITLDSTENYDAYKKLFDIYEAAQDTDAILELKKNVTSSKVLKLFENYIVTVPSLNLPTGTYSEKIKLSMTADKNVQIFYTLNGKNPISNGTLYTGAIELSDAGMHTVKAVAKNSSGIYSDIITQTYVIRYDAPADPKVSPMGGTFYTPTYIYINVPEGCSAYYTWDRSTPTIESEKYTAPILIPEGYNILSVVIMDDVTGLSSGVYRDVFEYVVE